MKNAAKGNSLLAAVSRAAAPSPLPEPTASTASRRKPQPSLSEPSNPRPGRVGTKLIGGHFEPAVARQLRLIAAEEDTTIQALLAEALDLLFVKKGKTRVSLSGMGVREQ